MRHTPRFSQVDLTVYLRMRPWGSTISSGFRCRMQKQWTICTFTVDSTHLQFQGCEGNFPAHYVHGQYSAFVIIKCSPQDLNAKCSNLQGRDRSSSPSNLHIYRYPAHAQAREKLRFVGKSTRNLVC